MSEEENKGSEEKAEKKEKKQSPAAPQAIGGIAAREASKVKWSIDRCKKYARRFHNEEEWKVGSPSSFKAAFANGWMKECSKEFIKDNVVSLAKVNEGVAKRIEKESA